MPGELTGQSEPDLPRFIAEISGLPIKSTTDEGAVLELMDHFGMAPPRPGPPRDYDAETARMRTPIDPLSGGPDLG